MRIVTTTGVYKVGFDTFTALDKLSAAGFRTIDLSLAYCWTENHEFYGEHWLDWAKRVRAYADEKGLTFYQCHGVGAPSQFYHNPDDPIYRVIKTAEVLGIKWIVMHPENVGDKTDPCYYELFAEENAKWFSLYRDRCEASGVGMAVENLPWACCNRARRILDIVERLDSKSVGVCWDTGHANMNHLPPSEMELLGDKLVTVHIHDSVDYHDHLIPYHGNYDWTGFIHTLRKMNYKGEFVLEAHHQMLEAEGDEEKQNRLLAELLEVSNKIMRLP